MLFNRTTFARMKSVDSSTTVEEDEREAQRLKDEETVYESNIKWKILDAALDNVSQYGWTKESLALGNLLC